MPNTVILKGRGIRKEREAGGAITPGHLVEVTSADAVVVHATAAASHQKTFAVEAEVVGRDLTDAYAATDTVFYEACHSGQEVNGILTTSQTIAIGDELESAGDGTLRAKTVFAQSGTTPFAVTPEGHLVGIAIEAVTTTGATSRIKIEVA